MKPSNKIILNSMLSMSIVFTVIAWGLVFTPLFVFAYYPGVVALLFALLAFLVARKNKVGVKTSMVLSILALVLIAFITTLALTKENKVANDEVIEKVVEKESKQVDKDLDAAMDELE
jgi:MFS-type transporter involved in bile tolerance (Atg22 family)